MGEEHHHGQGDRLGVFEHAHRGSDCRDRPERRRGREASDLTGMRYDHAGAEKADAGGDGDGAQRGTGIARAAGPKRRRVMVRSLPLLRVLRVTPSLSAV